MQGLYQCELGKIVQKSEEQVEYQPGYLSFYDTYYHFDIIIEICRLNSERGHISEIDATKMEVSQTISVGGCGILSTAGFLL